MSIAHQQEPYEPSFALASVEPPDDFSTLADVRDALNRRTRLAPPQPAIRKNGREDKDIELTPRDRLIFELLNRHGPLPSNYLFELTRHLPGCRDHNHFLKRLTKLYNGVWVRDVHINYLTQPEWQGAPSNLHKRPLVYWLNPLSVADLQERDIRIVKHTDPDIHQFMGACCGASEKFYYECQRYRFASIDDLLKHAKCPEATRKLKDPLRVNVNGKILIPDDIIAKERESLACHPTEIDRKTESISSNVADISIVKKFALYDEAIRRDAFLEHLGIPARSIYPKIITTNPVHMRNIAAEAAKLPTAKQFRFSWVAGFGKKWDVPRQLLYFKWWDAFGNEVGL